MKTVIALCALSLVLTLPWHCSSASPQEQKHAIAQSGTNPPQNNRKWQAATYLGLTIGKSNWLDVLRVLGEPKRLDRPPDQTLGEKNREIWYAYDSNGEFAGDLTVVIDERTNVVLRIDLHPNKLTREDAVKHFGPDFIVTRYAFDDCLGNEEAAPLYESAHGPVLNVEYRHRGIAISVTEAGKVDTISYVSKPLGTPTSRCKTSNTQTAQ